MWLISPTEPADFDSLGRRSPIPEQFGVDFFTGSHLGMMGVQRKTTQDFLASVVDGRLERELAQMKRLNVWALVIEGEWQWTPDGRLLDSPGWRRSAVTAMLWSIQLVHGAAWWPTRNLQETAESLRALEQWMRKASHESFLRRPKPFIPPWGRQENRDWAIHLLQSFPGIGPERAARIYDHFGKVPLRWEVSERELASVSGIGSTIAKRLVEALRR